MSRDRRSRIHISPSLLSVSLLNPICFSKLSFMCGSQAKIEAKEINEQNMAILLEGVYFK